MAVPIAYSAFGDLNASVCIPVTMAPQPPFIANQCGYVPPISTGACAPCAPVNPCGAVVAPTAPALPKQSVRVVAPAPATTVAKTSIWPTVIFGMLAAAVIASAIGLFVWWINRNNRSNSGMGGNPPVPPSSNNGSGNNNIPPAAPTNPPVPPPSNNGSGNNNIPPAAPPNPPVPPSNNVPTNPNSLSQQQQQQLNQINRTNQMNQVNHANQINQTNNNQRPVNPPPPIASAYNPNPAFYTNAPTNNQAAFNPNMAHNATISSNSNGTQMMPLRPNVGALPPAGHQQLQQQQPSANVPVIGQPWVPSSVNTNTAMVLPAPMRPLKPCKKQHKHKPGKCNGASGTKEASAFLAGVMVGQQQTQPAQSQPWSGSNQNTQWNATQTEQQWTQQQQQQVQTAPVGRLPFANAGVGVAQQRHQQTGSYNTFLQNPIAAR